MKKLEKKLICKTQMDILTGIHIGDSKDNVEIGGIDNPIVRRTIDKVPYIPGSSLKGKIRSLLEQIAGASEVGGNPEINNLFGFANNSQPSKIIVRDAYLDPQSQEILKNSDYTDMPYAEVKFENVIDRIKGTAKHPRQMERVPAGVKFNVEFVINVWTDDDEDELIVLLEKGIKAIENDYLGGSGSRGYGQVKFSELKKEEISFENYFEN